MIISVFLLSLFIWLLGHTSHSITLKEVGIVLSLLSGMVTLLWSISLTTMVGTEIDDEFKVTSTPSIVKVQHLVTDDIYVVHYKNEDGGSFNTMYTNAGKDITDSIRFVDSDKNETLRGYQKDGPMNILAPWEIKRPHVDVAYYKATDIENLP